MEEMDWKQWLVANYKLALKDAGRIIAVYGSRLEPGDLVQGAVVKILLLQTGRTPTSNVRGFFYCEMMSVAKNDRRRRQERLHVSSEQGAASEQGQVASPWTSPSERGSITLDEYHLHALQIDIATAKTDEGLRGRAVDLGAFVLVYVRGVAARLRDDWTL
jgi:DNA-directed RNA polymerase specialized sigma24 family protein